MPRAFSIFAWILAAMWLPATLHCAVDRAGLLPSAPACCADDEAPMAQVGSCETRCEPLDKGRQQIDQEPLRIAAPTLLPFSICPADVPLMEIFACQILPDTADPPPELGRTWQFVSRAALPPRAP